jgi:hypothetical protein
MEREVGYVQAARASKPANEDARKTQRLEDDSSGV